MVTPKLQSYSKIIAIDICWLCGIYKYEASCSWNANVKYNISWRVSASFLHILLASLKYRVDRPFTVKVFAPIQHMLIFKYQSQFIHPSSWLSYQQIIPVVLQIYTKKSSTIILKSEENLKRKVSNQKIKSKV